MAKTLKGEAATIVNGLSAQLPSQFEHLIAAVMEHRSGCGGSTRVNTLAAAAAQFNQHCEMLRTAQHIYASMDGPEEERTGHVPS